MFKVICEPTVPSKLNNPTRGKGGMEGGGELGGEKASSPNSLLQWISNIDGSPQIKSLPSSRIDAN